ncbi:MAG: N-acetylmuramoyl-L-alanine amidase-like domain-containing protein, partial [Parabacteroides sp.]
MNLLKIVFVLLSVTVQAAAQVVYLPSDSLVFEKCMQAMDINKDLPLQDLVVQTALYFEGTPYVASTLEQTPEQLVVNLREFDCTTFVESVLALS